METINQMASAAVKAVWGEGDTSEQTHKEPVSGATGDVSKGEPYDAGNMDAEDQSKVASTLNGSEDLITDAPPTGGAQNDQRDTTVVTDDTQFLDANKTKGSTESTDVNPGAGDLKDVPGDGPQPLKTIARENGGDAATAARTNETDISPPVGAKEADPDDKGTGEQYVKTTGLAADGGDFDAAKPGAGREADRLMENKGLRGDDGDKAAGGDRHGKDKPSLGERIKHKLHKH